jgi:hypothetical protein
MGRNGLLQENNPRVCVPFGQRALGRAGGCYRAARVAIKADAWGVPTPVM